MLDRAALALAPIGLRKIARSLTGESSLAAPPGLDMARTIVQILHDEVGEAGDAARLPAVVDDPGPGLQATLSQRHLEEGAAGESDSEREQLRFAGAIHGVTGKGTATILLHSAEARTPEGLIDLLRFAWERTQVIRVIPRAPER